MGSTTPRRCADIGADLLPALALGAEPPEPGMMARPPRTRSARSLDGAVLARAFGFLGPVEAVASLAMLPVGAALLLGWRPGVPCRPGPALATLSTMVSAAIVLAQMANAFEGRSTVTSLRTLGPATNRLLVGWSPSSSWRCSGSSTWDRCRSCSATNG